MAKVFNLVMLMIGVLLLLGLAGFPTATNWILGSFGLTANSSGINWSAGILSVLAIVTIGGIFTLSAVGSGSIQIGTFVINTTESKIVATVANAVMAWFILDLISIIQVANTFGEPWVGTITALMVLPMIGGVVFAMVNWWRGNDI